MKHKYSVMVCYIIHTLASELCKILSGFPPILLWLVFNNCILPVPLRDTVGVTVFGPLASFVWFYTLKTSKRSHDDCESFVMICN